MEQLVGDCDWFCPDTGIVGAEEGEIVVEAEKSMGWAEPAVGIE